MTGALPPLAYTASESAGWRARMHGESRKSPYTQRKYVRQWNAGWDAANAHLARVGSS